MNQKNRTVIIVMFVLAFLTVGIIIATLGLSEKNTVDQFPEDGLNIDITSQASIVSSEELPIDMGGVAAFENLSRDLYAFGSIAYEPYINKTTEVIGFRVDNTTKEANTLQIEGKFGSSNNPISITVKLLQNDRITTSITDKKTDLNIDSLLPSNSQINQFIGTLPYDNGNYVVNYVDEDNFFSVNIVGEGVIDADIYSFIEKSVGTENFNRESVFIYGSGGSSIINNDF
jgi:hypothetical protein